MFVLPPPEEDREENESHSRPEILNSSDYDEEVGLTAMHPRLMRHLDTHEAGTPALIQAPLVEHGKYI